MISALRVVFSMAFWVYLALSSAALFVVALAIFLVTYPFDRDRRVLHFFTCLWATHYVWLNPMWSVAIEGREHIDEAGQPALLVANHQSLADILVLFGLFRTFKWVSKRSIFAVPLIGWNMRLNGYVSLVRGDSRSIAEMLEACRRWLRRGVSVIMFPEGTRSFDGEIQAFKTGAFGLAVESALPVVPIVIDGTHDALPKHGLVLRRRSTIRVHVLTARRGGDVATLLSETRTAMLEELARMRGRSV